MREVLGFSTAGGGKPLKGETVALQTSDKMDASGLEFCIKPSNIPGYLDLTPEQARRLIRTEPLTDYYDVEEEPFARGKYAAVRRCRHKSTGRHFAAKFLRKRRRSTDLRTEIVHEVAVLESCRGSPRVVRLHEVYESTQEMVLLLELACGGELQMLLDKDEVPSEHQVLRLMRQILDGLIHLHSINVAHLDIKPQNLVLTGKFPDCDVKLCDFGISRFLSEGVDVREILGTPDYVAPEVLNYEPISLATDMWSVGVLLYVLLTGCSPFGGDTKQETFCNITQCRLDFPEDIFEEISEDAKDLMRKLMVKNPSKRLSAIECLQHPWFTTPRPSSSLSSTSGLNSLNIGATTPRTPTLSKRPAPTMEHSEDRSLSTDSESDLDDTETAVNSRKNAEFDPCLVQHAEKLGSKQDSEIGEKSVQDAESCPKTRPNAEVSETNLENAGSGAEVRLSREVGKKSFQEAECGAKTCASAEIDEELGENMKKTGANSRPHVENVTNLGENTRKTSLNLQNGCEIAECNPSATESASNHHQGAETESCVAEIDPCQETDHHEDRSSTTSSCCLDHDEKSSTISSSSTLTAESGSDRCSVIGSTGDLDCENLMIPAGMFSGTACAGTMSTGAAFAGTTSAGIASKGLSGERKRSFMRNMESLVQKLTYTDPESPVMETTRENVNLNNKFEENSPKNINRLVNRRLDADLDRFLGSASKSINNENDCYRASTPNSRGNKSINFEESLSNDDTSYRLSSKCAADSNQELSDSSSDDSSSRKRTLGGNQYSSNCSYDSNLRRGSRLLWEDSKSSSSSSDDLRNCCGSATSDVKRHLKGNINDDASSRSMLKDSWYKDSKTCTSGARLRHVDGFRSLARASGMQTMPVSSFLHYKLDCGYNFLTRSSFGYESGDESMFKFRRVFILDDTDDRLSPPPSINGSLSSDNSISDSNSDTISEMSIDSSSDRSSIISLDDSLDFVYGKSLAQARHYSTSCYNVWEAVKSQAGASTRSRVCPRECDGSFARALSKFTSGETAELKDVSYKEGAFHRQRKSLTIFNGYNASTSSRATTPINKKCIGLELMREHNGNVVVIREVKAVHGSKFPRCSEVKCESVQSRIRRLQVQNGIRTELAKERYNVF